MALPFFDKLPPPQNGAGVHSVLSFSISQRGNMGLRLPPRGGAVISSTGVGPIRGKRKIHADGVVSGFQRSL